MSQRRPLLEFLDATIHWRPIVCTAATAALAFGLARWEPWFNGLPGLILGTSGLLPGVIWQARAGHRR